MIYNSTTHARDPLPHYPCWSVWKYYSVVYHAFHITSRHGMYSIDTRFTFPLYSFAVV